MTIQTIGVSVLILMGMMIVNETEATGIGDAPYLWTRYVSDPWYINVGHTDFDGQTSFTRRHFGFPCWAMMLDASTTNGSWYAKVDLRRLTANSLVSLVIAGFLVGGTYAIKRKRKSEPVVGGEGTPAPQR